MNFALNIIWRFWARYRNLKFSVYISSNFFWLIRVHISTDKRSDSSFVNKIHNSLILLKHTKKNWFKKYSSLQISNCQFLSYRSHFQRASFPLWHFADNYADDLTQFRPFPCVVRLINRYSAISFTPCLIDHISSLLHFHFGNLLITTWMVKNT